MNHHHNRSSFLGNGSTTTTTAAISTEMQPQSTKRFPSILVARSNLVRPSELEVCLRPHCQRQRVIEKLNGAHIVIPGQGETTLALRAYYPIDLQQQQQEKATCINPNPTTVPRHQVLQHIHQQHPPQHDLGGCDNAELNGLRLFQRSFAVTIVFFVLPQDSPERQHQYDDIGSFMHRATSLLMDHQPTTSSSGHNNNINNMNNNDKKKSSIRMTRVFVVQDTAQAIETIMVLADALSPEKRLLKRAFFKRQRVANFMPIANLLNNNNTDHPQEQQQQQQQLDTVAASQAAGTIRQWASNFQLPPGEADVIMNFFGSCLHDILTATEDQLAPIPIEDRTRTLLHMFFESSPSPSSIVGHAGGSAANVAAAQDHQRYYHHPPQNHQHDVTTSTFAVASTAPSVGHEAVWNGTTAASTMYGGGGASYNNPSCLPGRHAISGTNNMNGNHMPYPDAAMYQSNPQSFMPMTEQNVGGQQSLLATGGPPSAHMAQPATTPAYLLQQQQQQHQQQQHGPPPMTQGRAYLQGGGGGGATMMGSTSSMYYGNNTSQFAGVGVGGGGGGGPFLSQREQMRRWM